MRDRACGGDCTRTVTVVVPSGALGNIAAGAVARAMGLPVRLVAAVNDNDVVVRFLQSGVLSTGQGLTVTLSPSMDIQVGDALCLLRLDCARYANRALRCHTTLSALCTWRYPLNVAPQ